MYQYSGVRPRHKLLSSYKNQMISFMNAHPELFEEAINLAISDKNHMPDGLRSYYGAEWKGMIGVFKNILES
jgi:hypothetical protein